MEELITVVVVVAALLFKAYSAMKSREPAGEKKSPAAPPVTMDSLKELFEGLKESPASRGSDGRTVYVADEKERQSFMEQVRAKKAREAAEAEAYRRQLELQEQAAAATRRNAAAADGHFALEPVAEPVAAVRVGHDNLPGFIRANGLSAIAISEILAPPLALRDGIKTH